MDKTLTIQLAFFAAAVPVALDAYKARGISRFVLWGVAFAFALSGLVWPWASQSMPKISDGLSVLATDPVTWLVLAVSVFFVLRPIWIKPTPNAQTPPQIVDVDDYAVKKLHNANERIAQLDRRIVALEKGDGSIEITPTSHKGKPLKRLTNPERERVSAALLAVSDYLARDFEAFLAPYKELRNPAPILQEAGGEGYHAMVETPRPAMRAFIDGFMETMRPYEKELLILGLDVSLIKTKCTPLWDAVREVSNVSQMLPMGPTNGEALKLPLRHLGEVLESIQSAVDGVQNEITRWRLKISRGEL